MSSIGHQSSRVRKVRIGGMRRRSGRVRGRYWKSMGIDCSGGSNNMDQERLKFAKPVPRVVSHPIHPITYSGRSTSSYTVSRRVVVLNFSFYGLWVTLEMRGDI
jgi:hypothetical protein